MAIRPSLLDNAPLYHWTKPENVTSLLRGGVVPWDEHPEGLNKSQYENGAMQTRPGHVYMTVGNEDIPHWIQADSLVPLKVDPSRLDPNDVVSDEDWAKERHDEDRYEMDPDSYEAIWESAPESHANLGDWADLNGDILDSRDMTGYSFGLGTLAYRGTIPSYALSLVDGYEYPEDAHRVVPVHPDQQELFPRHIAGFDPSDVEPYWSRPERTEFTEDVPMGALKRFLEYDRPIPDDDYMNYLRQSIQEHGVTTPIGLEYNPDTGRIHVGEGNHRIKIADELGLSHLPAQVFRSSREPAGPGRHEDGSIGLGGAFAPKIYPPDDYGYVPGNLKPSDLGIEVVRSIKQLPKAAAFDKSIWEQRDQQPRPGQMGLFEPPSVQKLWDMGADFDYHSPSSEINDLVDLGLSDDYYGRRLLRNAEDLSTWAYEQASERAWSRGDSPFWTDDPVDAERFWRENGGIGGEAPNWQYPYYEDEEFDWAGARQAMEYGEAEWQDFAIDQERERMPEDALASFLMDRLHRPSRMAASRKTAMPLSPDDPGLPTTFYHVSPAENHDNIMAGGLIPGAGPSPWIKDREEGRLKMEAPYGVYLWDHPENAISYAHVLAQKQGLLGDEDILYSEDEGPSYNIYAIDAGNLPNVRMDPENSLLQRPDWVQEGNKGYGELSFEEAMREYRNSYNPMFDEYDADVEEGHRYYSPDHIPASAIRLHESVPVRGMDEHGSMDARLVPEVFTRVPDLMNSPLADPDWKQGAFDRSKWEQRAYPPGREQTTIFGCPDCGSTNIYGDYGYGQYDLESPEWHCEDCGHQWWGDQADTTRRAEGWPEIDYDHYLETDFVRTRGHQDIPYYESENVQRLYDIAKDRKEIGELIEAYDRWRETQYARADELEEYNRDYLNEGRPDYEEDPEGHDGWYESDEYKSWYDDLMREHHPALSALEEFEKLLGPHRKEARIAAQFEESEPCPYCQKVNSYGVDEFPGLRACRSCGMAWRTEPVTRAETLSPRLTNPTADATNTDITEWAKSYKPTANAKGLEPNPQVHP